MNAVARHKLFGNKRLKTSRDNTRVFRWTNTIFCPHFVCWKISSSCWLQPQFLLLSCFRVSGNFSKRSFLMYRPVLALSELPIREAIGKSRPSSEQPVLQKGSKFFLHFCYLAKGVTTDIIFMIQTLLWLNSVNTDTNFWAGIPYFQISEQEYHIFKASNKWPSTPYSRNTTKVFHEERDHIPQQFKNFSYRRFYKNYEKFLIALYNA